MNLLKKEYSKNSLWLSQVKRTEKIALYSVHLTENGPITGFEVFCIRISPGRTKFGRFYPEHEHYPSNEEFGKIAWCWCTREQAEKCFQALESAATQSVVIGDYHAE